MLVRCQRGNRSLKYTIIRNKNWRALCPHYRMKAKIFFILWNYFQTILLFANEVGLTLIADTILFLHFCVVIFLTSGLFLVPIGYKLDWAWTANLKLRLCHIGLIRSCIGICPRSFLLFYMPFVWVGCFWCGNYFRRDNAELFKKFVLVDHWASEA